MNSQTKTALITGIHGQDGSYLAEHLLLQGYRVYGTSRAGADPARVGAITGISGVFKLDLSQMAEIHRLVEELRPSEIYNFAARSSSSQLFDDPIATADINAIGATRFLEAIRLASPATRFCQAASSEIFAGVTSVPQDESTPYRPLNAYGAAKAYAANIVVAYRARYGLHASTAIVYNHESPRRGLHYVTRKISRAVAEIALGRRQDLVLGSLDSRRDWGFAGDYARAMWLMLQQEHGDDYLVATGVLHSVRDFCAFAFAHVDLDYRDFVRVDQDLVRATDPAILQGNPAKARGRLGWQPSVDFPQLVHMMVDADLALLRAANPSS